MDRTGAACYVYAKASGMLAKSFVGSKAVKLFNVKSLQELWSLLFTDEVPAVPQTILALALGLFEILWASFIFFTCHQLRIYSFFKLFTFPFSPSITPNGIVTF